MGLAILDENDLVLVTTGEFEGPASSELEHHERRGASVIDIKS